MGHKKSSYWTKEFEVQALKASLLYNYQKKYSTLFKARFNLQGFDYGVDYYILDNIYKGISLASFKLKTAVDTSIVGFQPFSANGFDMYNNPIRVKITPALQYDKVPTENLTNNEDCALFRCDFSFQTMIAPLIDRLVDLDMTIRTNIKLHKIPFLVNGINAYKIVSDVLADKEVVGASDDDNIENELKSTETRAPFIIDKLQQAKIATETEILTILGVKGQKHEKMAQMTVDEVKMNDDEVNGYYNRVFDKITAWLDKTNSIFGTNFSIIENKDIVDENQDAKKEETKQEEEPNNGVVD